MRGASRNFLGFHPLAYRAAGSPEPFQIPYSNRSREAAHASRISIILNGDVVFAIELSLLVSRPIAPLHADIGRCWACTF